MRFIQNLTPLLTAAPNPAHVISIFAGSVEGSHSPDALPIGVPPPASYGVTAVRNHVVFMKTFFFEELAEKHAGQISFIHIYPGLVDGPGFYTNANPLWFRIAWRLMKPLFSWYMTSPDVCGDVMVFLATKRYAAKGVESGAVVGGLARSSQGEVGGGTYAVGQRGDENKGVSYEKVRKGDTGKRVWEHTIETIDEGLKKGAVA
jgi:hypothetical protein